MTDQLEKSIAILHMIIATGKLNYMETLEVLKVLGLLQGLLIIESVKQKS